MSVSWFFKYRMTKPNEELAAGFFASVQQFIQLLGTGSQENGSVRAPKSRTIFFSFTVVGTLSWTADDDYRVTGVACGTSAFSVTKDVPDDLSGPTQHKVFSQPGLIARQLQTTNNLRLNSTVLTGETIYFTQTSGTNQGSVTLEYLNQ